MFVKIDNLGYDSWSIDLKYCESCDVFDEIVGKLWLLMLNNCNLLICIMVTFYDWNH